MSEYIKVKDNKAIGHFCGPLPIGDDIKEVPDAWPFYVEGVDVQNFDSSWNLRPLADRVADGLVVVSEAEKIVGEAVVAKTALERIRDGIDSAPTGQKLVTATDGTLSLEDMTLAEKVAAGQITQATADISQALNMRVERTNRYAPSDDAHLALDRQIRVAEAAGTDTTMLKATLAKWDTYAQALADVPEQGGFPWAIIWPTRPDGVVM